MKITTDYTAGFLDNVGGFYVLNGKHPQFKISIQKHTDRYPIMEEIVKFLEKEHNIEFSPWEDEQKKVYQITAQKTILKLISFIEKYCYTTKSNQKETKELVLGKLNNDKKKR